MVMFLHYYASLIYFLTSDITVTSWEDLQRWAEKEHLSFENVWIVEITRTKTELHAYIAKPALTNQQTLEPFFQAWESSWARNVINTDAFAGWGETQEGKEHIEWKNAMDWYWHEVSSLTQKLVNDSEILADLPPYIHEIFAAIPKKMQFMQHICFASMYNSVICEVPLPNKLVLKDIYTLQSQTGKGVLTLAIKKESDWNLHSGRH